VTLDENFVRRLRLAFGRAVSEYLAQMDDTIPLVDVHDCEACIEAGVGCPGVPTMSDAVWREFTKTLFWSDFVAAEEAAADRAEQQDNVIRGLNAERDSLYKAKDERQKLFDEAIAKAAGFADGEVAWWRLLEAIESTRREVLTLRQEANRRAKEEPSSQRTRVNWGQFGNHGSIPITTADEHALDPDQQKEG
jgi:hypothetical protein